MRQPRVDAIDNLREFLRFAVPMRSISLVADHTPEQLEPLLIGMAKRGGAATGSYGDGLLFSGGNRKIVTRAADDLVTGIAAMALMAGPDGITVLDVHFCPAAACKHETAVAA
jgi:hypothetical protein